MSSTLFRGRSLPLLLFIAGCSAPRPAPVSTESALKLVGDRQPDRSQAIEALALADLDRLDFQIPAEADVVDPSEDGYWHVAAWAWSPEVRSARAHVYEARARIDSAGAPGPVDLRALDHEFGGEDALVEAMATFDLIGLLGLGPSSAARELAGTEELLALARLEEAIWAARFRVDRARVRVAAARARAELLQALHDEAAKDYPRLVVLERNGRISRAQYAVADGRLHSVEHRASRARDAWTEARTELVLASGLPVGHPALAAEERSWLTQRSSISARTASIPDDHPVLRAARIVLARDEAALRDVASRAWPGLRFGPHLGFPGDGTRVGGVLNLTLPFPSQWEGELEAAEVRRDRSEEAYMEVVHEQMARVDQAQTLLLEAIERRVEHATPIEDASSSGWEATRLRFRVNEANTDEWGRALEKRADAIMVLIEEDESVALAALDLAEAAGPRGVTELQEVE